MGHDSVFRLVGVGCWHRGIRIRETSFVLKGESVKERQPRNGTGSLVPMCPQYWGGMGEERRSGSIKRSDTSAYVYLELRTWSFSPREFYEHLGKVENPVRVYIILYRRTLLTGLINNVDPSHTRVNLL